MLYLSWVFLLCWAVKCGGSVSYQLPALSELSLLIFKYSELSFANCKTSHSKLHWFSAPNIMGTPLMVWVSYAQGFSCGVCSSHFSLLIVFVPFSVSFTGSVCTCVSSPPTFFGGGLLSRINSGKSVLPVFWLFSELVEFMWLLCQDVHGNEVSSGPPYSTIFPELLHMCLITLFCPFSQGDRKKIFQSVIK